MVGEEARKLSRPGQRVRTEGLCQQRGIPDPRLPRPSRPEPTLLRSLLTWLVPCLLSPHSCRLQAVDERKG